MDSPGQIPSAAGMALPGDLLRATRMLDCLKGMKPKSDRYQRNRFSGWDSMCSADRAVERIVLAPWRRGHTGRRGAQGSGGAGVKSFVGNFDAGVSAGVKSFVGNFVGCCPPNPETLNRIPSSTSLRDMPNPPLHSSPSRTVRLSRGASDRITPLSRFMLSST